MACFKADWLRGLKCRQVVSSRYEWTRLDFRKRRVDRVRLSRKCLKWLWWGCIKCRQGVSSRYEWTRFDFRKSRVDRVRLSIKVREVVVMGVYKMSSSRVQSLRVDTTRLQEKSSRQSET